VRTGTKVFIALSAFGFGFGTLYWFLTHEPAGSILLWSLGLTSLVIAAWVIRRHAFDGLGPQDDEAPGAGGAGEPVGSFPQASVWPVFLVLGVIVTGAALVYGLLLLPVGIAIWAVAVVGLVRESRT
jgi:cytochrome c oxidase subunit IV